MPHGRHNPREDVGGDMRNRAASTKEGKQMITSGDSKNRTDLFHHAPGLEFIAVR
jgi:hypothetical protein